ncbi:hypothetical protein TNCV_2127961 [Trichonephila clavipes]|nr:hypothetical protein TNCV_2127961 [Trichonephila clavipes]
MTFVIKTWNVIGACQIVLRPGKPTKLRDKDGQVLSKKFIIIIPNPDGPPPRLPTSIKFFCFNKYHIFLGFHGSAAMHANLIIKSNHAARLRRCKTLRNWTANQRIYAL